MKQSTFFLFPELEFKSAVLSALKTAADVEGTIIRGKSRRGKCPHKGEINVHD